MKPYPLALDGESIQLREPGVTRRPRNGEKVKFQQMIGGEMPPSHPAKFLQLDSEVLMIARLIDLEGSDRNPTPRLPQNHKRRCWRYP